MSVDLLRVQPFRPPAPIPRAKRLGLDMAAPHVVVVVRHRAAEQSRAARVLRDAQRGREAAVRALDAATKRLARARQAASSVLIPIQP